MSGSCTEIRQWPVTLETFFFRSRNLREKPLRSLRSGQEIFGCEFEKRSKKMEELRSAMEEHMDQMANLVEKFSDELRSGLRPAYDNFIGFFHAIDWKVCTPLFPLLLLCLVSEKILRIFVKETLSLYILRLVFLLNFFFLGAWFLGFPQEPWLIGLMGFYVVLLLITITSRRNINFQMSLFFLACK